MTPEAYSSVRRLSIISRVCFAPTPEAPVQQGQPSVQGQALSKDEEEFLLLKLSGFEY